MLWVDDLLCIDFFVSILAACGSSLVIKGDPVVMRIQLHHVEDTSGN